MYSIGNSALQQKFIDRMVSLLCEKNDLLCDGKCVNKVNAKLRKLYNYWSLFTDCDLTDAEINCINMDIGVDSPVVIITQPKPPVPELPYVEPQPELPEEPVYDVLTCAVNLISKHNPDPFDICTARTYTGSFSATVIALGGKTPYTYQWTVSSVYAPGTACYLSEAQILSNFGITGATTDTITASTASVGGYIVEVEVTDDLGNTTTCSVGINLFSLYE